MNLAVFVKHVPDTAEADLQVAADGRSIKKAGLPFQTNEWDRFALAWYVKGFYEGTDWPETTREDFEKLIKDFALDEEPTISLEFPIDDAMDEMTKDDE